MSNHNLARLDSEQALTPEVLNPEKTSYPIESDLEPYWKGFTLHDAGEILAEATGAIFPGGEKLMKAALGLGEYSPKERVKEEQFKWLLEVAAQMKEQLVILNEELPPNQQPEASDIAAILEAAMDASRKTADFKKRRLLKAAVVNSFNPKIYQAGLRLRLFSILNNVEYGDVELLYNLSQQGDTVEIKTLAQGVRRGELVFHYLGVLQKLELILLWNLDSGAPLGVASTGHLMVSELGQRFLEFVAEPDEN